MTTQNKTKAVVQWKGEPIAITSADVKRLICPDATEQEVGIFLKVCQSLNLNPWANEIYLIKYGKTDKAAIVIAIDAYLKAAEFDPNFDGYESGIVLRDARGGLEFREGSFLLDEERVGLVGGWARVYRKDRSRPFYVAVNKKECIRWTRDGRLTEFWTEEKQPWMLRKVALKRALLEAFTSLFSGLASGVDYEAMPSEIREAMPKPKGETTEGQLPPAYQKGNGETDWPKWWARQKEKGYTEDDYHRRFEVASMKDWLAAGHSLEEAEEIMDRERAKAEFTLTPAPPPATSSPASITRPVPPPPAGKAQGGRFSPGEASTTTLLPKSGPGEAGEVAPPLPKPPRDPASIKNFGELWGACQTDFKPPIPRSEAIRLLGFSRQDDITEPYSQLYLRLWEMRGA